MATRLHCTVFPASKTHISLRLPHVSILHQYSTNTANAPIKPFSTPNPPKILTKGTNFDDLIKEDEQRNTTKTIIRPNPPTTFTKGSDIEELVQDEQRNNSTNTTTITKLNTQKQYINTNKSNDFEEMIRQDEQKKVEFKKIGVRFTPEQLNAEIQKIVSRILLSFSVSLLSHFPLSLLSPLTLPPPPPFFPLFLFPILTPPPPFFFDHVHIY